MGWDNNVLAAAFLPLTHLRPHSTWHRLQMRGGWGGVGCGWDNNVLAAVFLPLTHLQPHSTWHRFQMKRQYNVPVHGDRLSRDHAVHGCSRQVVTGRLTLVFIVDLYSFFPLRNFCHMACPDSTCKHPCRAIRIGKNINVERTDILAVSSTFNQNVFQSAFE